MQNISLEEIEKARNGSAKDMKNIFCAFSETISIYAAQLKNDYFDYDDAAQEGNVGLFKAILSYCENKGSSFPTYAKKCILNNMLSARKAAMSKKHSMLNNAMPLDESILLQSFENDFLIKEQNREFIKIAKQKLSDFEFLVFSLYTMQYSYKEIASVVGKNEKSVNNAIQRIHTKLRK